MKHVSVYICVYWKLGYLMYSSKIILTELSFPNYIFIQEPFKNIFININTPMLQLYFKA